MKRKIECEIAQTEGSLIRVLGVIERRGYKLLELSVLPAGPDACQMSFCIESTRDVSVLVRQLERLYDVCDVFLLPVESAVARSVAEPHAAPNFQASWLAG